MIENREGKKVPEVIFKSRSNNQFVDVSTSDIFSGKTVVVSSLPGAYTPTCSASHLPRFNELAASFKENGGDDIVCISVNDAFVMDAWKKEQEADNVTLIADGNGDFTRGMGMLVDKSDLGFGQRSWRYSMLVRDGYIEKQFIEPEVSGDLFEVSDADTMLNYINPNVKKPLPVSLFTKPGCPYCLAAKSKLEENGLDYEEIVLGKDATMRSLKAMTAKETVPQIFINGRHIGSGSDFEEWLKQLRVARC
ncbi:MAG: glutathione peroxidase [Gammaproteobacteria bacterium]